MYFNGSCELDKTVTENGTLRNLLILSSTFLPYSHISVTVSLMTRELQHAELKKRILKISLLLDIKDRKLSLGNRTT